MQKVPQRLGSQTRVIEVKLIRPLCERRNLLENCSSATPQRGIIANHRFRFITQGLRVATVLIWVLHFLVNSNLAFEVVDIRFARAS